MSFPVSARRLLLAALLGALAGCEPAGPPTYHFSGQITHQGRPVPAGLVYFDPDPIQGHGGQQGYALIKDGQYDTRTEGGQAASGGFQNIRIFGFDGQPGEELPQGKAIFPEHSVAVELPQGDGVWNYDVPAAPALAPAGY